jgi:HipA-like kinase
LRTTLEEGSAGPPEWDPEIRPLLLARLTISFRHVVALHDYPEVPKKGASRPLYLYCDDQTDYVVKFPVQNWPKALVNEVVGAGLLEELGLNAPTAAIVTIPPELAAVSSQLQKRGVAPGEYFGTRRLANPIDLTDAVTKKLHPAMIENRVEAAGLIAYDNWVRNKDRNDGNVLLVGSGSAMGPHFRLFAIDNGLILTGEAWTAELLRQASTGKERVGCHPFLVSCVWGKEEFLPTRVAIERFDELPIREKLFPVPGSWGLGDVEREAIAAFLLERRGVLAEILEAYPLQPDKEGS